VLFKVFLNYNKTTIEYPTIYQISWELVFLLIKLYP
jgi:hypothetical protein